MQATILKFSVYFPGTYSSTSFNTARGFQLNFPKIAAKIDESERLQPEELNQQNIEALVAENNLVLSSCILFLAHTSLIDITAGEIILVLTCQWENGNCCC